MTRPPTPLTDEVAGACRDVLGHLAERTGIACWFVAALHGDWLDVVAVVDRDGAGPRKGQRLNLHDTVDAADLGGGVAVHVAVALRDPRGEVLGTLCAADRRPTPAGIAYERALARALAPLVAGLLAARRDAADRREAARRIARALADMRSILGAAGEGILALDPEGVVSYANPAASALTGRPADELVGRPVTDLLRPPSSRIGGDDEAARDLATGPDHRGTVLMWRADGTSFPAEYVRTLRDEAGAAVVVFSDVAERHDAERALRRREAEIRELSAEQAGLLRVATAVARGAEPEAIFGMVAEESARLLGATAGRVARFEDEEAVVVGTWGESPAVMGARTKLRGPGALARVHAEGAAVRVRTEGRQIAAAPVNTGSGPWGAVMVARAVGPAGFDAGAEDRLCRFAELVSLAIANADARTELAVLATTDPLTGLPNRRALLDRLAAEIRRSRRQDRPLSVVAIDIDRFKAVNDRHGHQAGDRVLVEVARRLSSGARAGDMIARIGGEEFVWLLPDSDAERAVEAANRARRAVSGEPIEGVGRVTISGGVCELDRSRERDDPRRAPDAQSLLERADRALYRAKAAGRDVCLPWEPGEPDDPPARS